MSGIASLKNSAFGANRVLSSNSGTLYADNNDAISGLQPQYGMTWPELLAYITSNSNNMLVAPPPSLVSACNTILRTDQIGATFNNTPNTVRVSYFPNFANLNPNLNGGDFNIVPFAKFDLTSSSPKMFTDMSYNYSLAVYACKIGNGVNSSGVRQSKTVPIDPMEASSFHIVNQYDRNGQWTGIDLVGDKPSPNGYRTITVIGDHNSLQIMFVLYRGNNPIANWLMADTNPVELTKVVPCGFYCVFENIDETGDVVSKIDQVECYPGQLVALCPINARNPNVVKASVIDLEIVYRAPSDEEVSLAIALTRTIPGAVNWSTRATRYSPTQAA